MKYTRYNVKPKNKKKSKMVYLIVVIIIALLFTYLVMNKFDFKKLQVKDNQKVNIESVENQKDVKNKKENVEKKEESNEKVTQSEKSEIVFIPCGVFKVKENADKVVKNLQSIGCPFILNEGDITKVYYGVSKNNEEYEKESKKLSDMKIEHSKNTKEIKYKDLSMAELGKIIEAEIEIINNVKAPNIKSVKTGELKKWVSQLEKVDEKSLCYNEVKKIEEHINSLPEEVSKNEGGEMSKFIYNLIKDIENK